ncbi:hypothetical protein J4217_03755 [Candidatus Pacearchaeota archaeon]|nr:hypothetical protein [uncultured archaeon]AQS33245.1 hypothetical protein [uncultured archaeon]MBS3091534.1 hypothetical protein [Candidatus Pacearchaeota archaeon]
MRKGENYITQLAEYVKKNLRKGYTKESLKWALVNQGHSKLEVEKAMQKAESDLAAEAPVLRTKPEIKIEIVEPKDAVLEKKPWWKRIFG